MREILFIVLMAGVFGAATASAASFIFLVRKKRFWRRALTVAMLAVLVASARSHGADKILYPDGRTGRALPGYACDFPDGGRREHSRDRTVGSWKAVGEKVLLTSLPLKRLTPAPAEDRRKLPEPCLPYS